MEWIVYQYDPKNQIQIMVSILKKKNVCSELNRNEIHTVLKASSSGEDQMSWAGSLTEELRVE